jgi:Zn-dependent protease
MFLSSLLNAVRTQDWLSVVAVMLALGLLLLSIALHESAHAYTANYLGDNTPRYMGRLTLNPLAHLDPIGTLMIIVVGFGYGRPVPFNPLALRTERRIGMALVSIAGPLTNIGLGVGFGLLLRFLFASDLLDLSTPLGQLAQYTLQFVVLLNFALAFFNMIPFPPLDGSKVLLALLPADMAWNLERLYMQVQQFGLLPILILFWFAGSLITPIILTPSTLLFRLVVGS